MSSLKFSLNLLIALGHCSIKLGEGCWVDLPHSLQHESAFFAGFWEIHASPGSLNDDKPWGKFEHKCNVQEYARQIKLATEQTESMSIPIWVCDCFLEFRGMMWWDMKAEVTSDRQKWLTCRRWASKHDVRLSPVCRSRQLLADDIDLLNSTVIQGTR